MGNIVKTAKCRFCGQMTQIEADEKLTAAQAVVKFTVHQGHCIMESMCRSEITQGFQRVKVLCRS